MSVTFIDTFEVIHCYSCGISFGMTADFKRCRLEDKKEFFCPQGHGQVYLGMTLKQELADAQQRERHAIAEKARIESNLQRLKTRIKNGVCPCCNRSFVNLNRHIKNKHPKYK